MRTPEMTATSLLTAEEVGQALSLPVSHTDATMTGPVRVIRFTTQNRRKPVLELQLAQGPAGQLAWRINTHGSPLAGIGDGAWTNGDRASTRRGDATVLLTLMREGRSSRAALPRLLSLVASRLP